MASQDAFAVTSSTVAQMESHTQTLSGSQDALSFLSLSSDELHFISEYPFTQQSSIRLQATGWQDRVMLLLLAPGPVPGLTDAK